MVYPQELAPELMGTGYFMQRICKLILNRKKQDIEPAYLKERDIYLFFYHLSRN